VGAASPEVVVIGAGAVGALCAYELARRGLRVRVLERRAPCRGTSGATFSWTAAHSKEPLAYHRFSREAIARFPGLGERLGVELALRPCFSLYAELEPDGYQARRDATLRKVEEGYGLAWLEGEEARALVPQLAPEVLGASLCRGEATIDAFQFVRGALRAAEVMGAELCLGEEATALEKDRHGIRAVRTRRERIPCRSAVLTTGAWGNELLATIGLRLPLLQVQGELLVTEPWPERLPGVVADVQQTPRGNLLLGVSWAPGQVDTATTAPQLSATAQRACRVLPFLERVRVIRSFAGVRPVPHDMVPYLGATGHCPGLVMALTHSGITLAPLLGEVVADAVQGRRHASLHHSFSPDRALERL
jgi:glycine/D-amino acid oxidase-like deaminating enzyme